MPIHFISGLPRAGSTLLAAILRQNPRTRAAVASPLYGMCMPLVRLMGASTEYQTFFNDDVRRSVLTSLFHGYYGADMDRLVFDSARLWAGKLDLIAALFPQARVVCCVRALPWILDSTERITRRNPLQSSALFGHDPGTSVYVRVASLMDSTKGFVGHPWSALREGWFSEQAHRLILLRYESLVASPGQSMDRLYETLGETPFEHDFSALSYEEPDYDLRLGMPGLHRVSGPVQAASRPTILPPELFERYASMEFWIAKDGNPRRVTVI